MQLSSQVDWRVLHGHNKRSFFSYDLLVVHAYLSKRDILGQYFTPISVLPKI